MSDIDNKAVIPLRVLVVEDSEDDTMLVLREIRKGGYEAVSERVETADTLRDALARQQWDLVISDFSMPYFDAVSALKIVRGTDPDLPFILVSGTITEETAVNALKAGAHDYVTKGNMARLVPAIARELSDAQVRREHRRMQKELEAYHAGLEKKVEERTAELKAAKERASFFASAIESSSLPFNSAYPDGRLMNYNQAFLELTGYGAEELRIKTWIELTPPKWRELEEQMLEELRRTGTPPVYQKEYIRKDGTQVPVELKVHLVRDEKGDPDYYYSFVTDITVRKRMEEELRHLAHHDSLTNLPNRRLFLDLFQVEAAQARRIQRKLAVLFLDLDRFKEINDTLGHELGDQLLRQVSVRLKGAVRESDIVSRIGGDEFNLLLSDIVHSEDAADAAGKIVESFRKPFLIAGHELTVTCSVGISIYPDDSAETETLFRYADIAMYYAKEHGRNMYRFYDPDINTRSIERMQFENSLRRAIERQEFRLYFQPMVDVKTNGFVSGEALLRWQHPEQGILEPEHFLRAAEELGFMTDIDEWVLSAVGRQIKTWMGQGLGRVCVTVNLSAMEFQKKDLARRIGRILGETGMPPECLDVEITETTAMGNIEDTIGQIRELTEMGVNVSIDDFGTGYSSLNQLKRLPIRKLKIDRSFIRDIATDAGDRTIITAVLLMAHAMKLKVVAEGVEGAKQLAFLRALHCDEAQGFYFSRPLPADRFGELVGRGMWQTRDEG